MFFILSKTLGTLTSRPISSLSLAAAGLALLWTRYARAGRRLLLGSLALLLVFGVLPVGKASMLVLEQRFPPWTEAGGPPDGIVILGGAVEPGRSAARGMVSINDSAERITAIAALARRFPDARIVFSGGSASLIVAGLPEVGVHARTVRELRHCALARDAGRTLAQHRRERALHAKRWSIPSPENGGFWSLRRCTCRARSAPFARRALPSRPTRSIGEPAAGAIFGGRRRGRWTGSTRATWPRRNGLGCWPIGSLATRRNCFPDRSPAILDAIGRRRGGNFLIRRCYRQRAGATRRRGVGCRST